MFCPSILVPRIAARRVRATAVLAISIAMLATLAAGAFELPLPMSCMPAPPRIAIQPLGAVDSALAQAVAAHLDSTLAAYVVVLPARSLPESAFYAPRSRYRGERVLRDLEAMTPDSISKVVGLMSRDLSVTKGEVHDWGVFGVAGLGRRAGVVSTYRLARRPADRVLLVRRLTRVVTHELGHTFGLDHCPSQGCLMNDADGSIRTVDESTGEFCAVCRHRLRSVLRQPPVETPVAPHESDDFSTL